MSWEIVKLKDGTVVATDGESVFSLDHAKTMFHLLPSCMVVADHVAINHPDISLHRELRETYTKSIEVAGRFVQETFFGMANSTGEPVR